MIWGWLVNKYHLINSTPQIEFALAVYNSNSCHDTWLAYCTEIEIAICNQHNITYTNKPNDASDGQSLRYSDQGWWLEVNG